MADAAPLTQVRSTLVRGVRFAMLGVVALGLIVGMIPAGMGWLSLWGLTHPRCGGGDSPASFGLTPELVEVPARTGITYAGYFFFGENGATIVVPPAYGAGRGGLLHEVAILVDAGYSVLTFDSRQCAGLSVHSLGYWEAEDIVDAVAYLQTRPDVDMARIGLHGFSQAGASNLFATASLPDVRAIVAEGGYVDYGAQTLGLGQDQGIFMTLFNAGARLGYRTSTGIALEALHPAVPLSEVGPQILLVYGEHEITLAGARELATKHPRVTLWEVPGATHGSYVQSVGIAVYAEQVVGFFDSALAAR